MSDETVATFRGGKLELNVLFDQSEYSEGEVVVVKITKAKSRKVRTLLQNASLHKYLTMLAQDLNDAGYDMKRTIKQEVDIPWNLDTAKEYLWKPIQRAMVNKERTRDLDTKEVGEVYETLNRYIKQKFGVATLWPERGQDGN